MPDSDVNDPSASGLLVGALARAVVGHPWRVLTVALLLSLGCGTLAWARLGIETDRMALIGEQHVYNRNFQALQREFRDLDAMVVVLQAGTREAERGAADVLAARLRGDRAFSHVFHRFPTQAPEGKALLFLSEDDLRGVAARLGESRALLGALFERGLGGFFAQAAERVEGLGAGGSEADAQALELLLPFADDLQRALSGQPGGEPWLVFAPKPEARDGYLWAQDGRLVLLVQPRRDRGERGIRGSVRRLRTHLGQLEASVPGLKAGLTGGPVLELDELETFWSDAQLATVASLVGVTLLLIVVSRRLLGPLLAVGALCCAIACTLGVAALYPGHLNLISMAFCALMAGLGVDYAIHLISRFDEERGRGLEGEEAMRGALSGTGKAIAGGAFTTALAFLATLFTDVQGIREFGVVAGVGIVLCMAASLIVLPAMLVIADRGRGGRTRRPHSAWARSRVAAGLDRLVEARPLAIVAGSTAVAVLSLVYAFVPTSPDRGGRLRYDSNLLALQAQHLESVRLAREVLNDRGLGGLFAAIDVHDRARLPEVEAAVRALPEVAGTDSILDVVGDQQAKLATIATIASLVDGLSPSRRPREARSAEAQLAGLRAGLEALLSALESVARAALKTDPRVTERVVALQERLEDLVDALEGAGRPARLERYEAGLCAELGQLLRRLRAECSREEVRDDELPAEIRERFVGRTGEYLLRVYPADDIWEAEHLEAFVTGLKGVVSDVGGVPVQFYESDRLIRRGYVRAAQIALAFVVFYLVLHFRGVVLPLVASVTLLVGASWGVGMLAVLGIDVNPANLIALPLTLGIGIDYAIHLVQRDQEARQAPSLAGAPAVLATSTGRSVLLSALTTLVGFGALTLSRHHGVASIGWTLCLAVVASLVAAILFCPALLRLLAGPAPPLALRGRPGPKTGPGGETLRPGQDPQPPDR